MIKNIFPGKTFFLWVLAASAGLSGCLHSNTDPQSSPAMEFRFVHRVGGEPLRLGSTEYTNAGSEIFTVGGLNYYVTDIKIKDDNGDVIHSSAEVWHVDVEDPSKLSFTIEDLPAVHFHTINFTVTAAPGVTQGQNYYLINFMGNVRNGGNSLSFSTGLETSLPVGENQFTYRSGGIHTSLETGKTTALEVAFDLLKWLDGDGSAPLDLADLAASGSLAQTDSIQAVLETNGRLKAFTTDIAASD